MLNLKNVDFLKSVKFKSNFNKNTNSFKDNVYRYSNAKLRLFTSEKDYKNSRKDYKHLIEDITGNIIKDSKGNYYLTKEKNSDIDSNYIRLKSKKQTINIITNFELSHNDLSKTVITKKRKDVYKISFFDLYLDHNSDVSIIKHLPIITFLISKKDNKIKLKYNFSDDFKDNANKYFVKKRQRISINYLIYVFSKIYYLNNLVDLLKMYDSFYFDNSITLEELVKLIDFMNTQGDEGFKKIKSWEPYSNFYIFLDIKNNLVYIEDYFKQYNIDKEDYDFVLNKSIDDKLYQQINIRNSNFNLPKINKKLFINYLKIVQFFKQSDIYDSVFNNEYIFYKIFKSLLHSDRYIKEDNLINYCYIQKAFLKNGLFLNLSKSLDRSCKFLSQYFDKYNSKQLKSSHSMYNDIKVLNIKQLDESIDKINPIKSRKDLFFYNIDNDLPLALSLLKIKSDITKKDIKKIDAKGKDKVIRKKSDMDILNLELLSFDVNKEYSKKYDYIYNQYIKNKITIEEMRIIIDSIYALEELMFISDEILVSSLNTIKIMKDIINSIVNLKLVLENNIDNLYELIDYYLKFFLFGLNFIFEDDEMIFFKDSDQLPVLYINYNNKIDILNNYKEKLDILSSLGIKDLELLYFNKISDFKILSIPKISEIDKKIFKDIKNYTNFKEFAIYFSNDEELYSFLIKYFYYADISYNNLRRTDFLDFISFEINEKSNTIDMIYKYLNKSIYYKVDSDLLIKNP